MTGDLALAFHLSFYDRFGAVTIATGSLGEGPKRVESGCSELG
jgi:hypothetical protein